jgi:uncharacterized phage protein gp47/JayE
MSETFGVLDTGFARMRRPEIRQAIIDNLAFRFGGPVETDPDSVIGELIDTFTDRETALWEMAQAVYLSMYPPTAFGVNLDNAVSFAGVRRFRAAQSTVYAALYGAEASIVPVGAQARLTGSQTLFDLADQVRISSNAAIDVTVAHILVANTTAYTIAINGVSYIYTSDASATLAEIVNGLAVATAPSGLSITTDGASLRYQSDGRTAFSIAIGANMSLTIVGSPGRFLADEVGPTEVPIGALSEIVTQTDGWTSVYNLQPGSGGRLDENDAELRGRYDTGVFQFGAGTVPSIRAGILDTVVGVTNVVVLENNTNATVSGLPPHSVHALVTGGDNLAIATALFNLVAGGIDTFGTTSVVVTDSQATAHTMHFSRPTPVYVWVKVVTSLLSEEAFPVNGLALIAQAIVAFGDTIPAGGDVVVQRFIGPIYNAASGLAGVTVTVASSTSPSFVPVSGDYTATNITITAIQQAVFDLSRVTVT